MFFKSKKFEFAHFEKSSRKVKYVRKLRDFNVRFENLEKRAKFFRSLEFVFDGRAKCLDFVNSMQASENVFLKNGSFELKIQL